MISSDPVDPDLTVRRLDLLARTATRLRRHIVDLHLLGWEPVNSRDPLEQTGSGEKAAAKTDWAPKTGHPSARRLYDRIAADVAQMAAELVGYDRDVTGIFYAGSQAAEPTRGSMISREEFDRRIGRQRARRTAGEYTPTPLVDQPQHPGAKT